ncbi:MAG: hypothetical protein ABIE23_06110 [archaeon]
MDKIDKLMKLTKGSKLTERDAFKIGEMIKHSAWKKFKAEL